MTGEWTPERIAELRAFYSAPGRLTWQATLDEIERLQARVAELAHGFIEASDRMDRADARDKRRKDLLREAVKHLDVNACCRAVAASILAEIGDER